ncbi:MAG: SAM-dependent methyltransferase [Gammaproteobacteria bacterium]|nr:MAG: SAM-dependent methyltransferase [Gammaproteobacteria bacterium]
MSTDSYTQQLYQSARDSKDLPAPGALAQKVSEELIALIKDEIDSNDGAISFQRYMELALYAPGLGYYTAGSAKLGEKGDFITAPEISPLFSQALANAILPVLNSEQIILEVGAGRGRMAADILVFLKNKNKLPEEYWILELSADLRERQKQTIAETIPEFIDKVKWLDTLPEKFSGVVLANELLDAMPVQLFQKNKNDINDVNVAWVDDKFAFKFKSSFDERLVSRVKNIEAELESVFDSGYVSEINFAAEDWIKSIAESLQQGVIVLIDYGFPRHEYYHAQRNQGTLMCHYQHRTHPDVFVYPGLQDITAHVDFTAMADAALESGLNIIGYTNQVSFLMGAGLIELAALNDEEDIKQQIETASQIKKLTLPHEMGELFKVIGFSKNCDVSLPAFEFRDLREHL